MIRSDLEKNGNLIGTMDMLIAGHARSLDVTLITHNTKDFCRVKNLEIEIFDLPGVYSLSPYTPEEIVVTTGAKQALYNSLQVIVNKGEEVIIPTPCWVSYKEMVKLAQGTRYGTRQT